MDTERKYRTNQREIRRLQLRIATQTLGRNAGATFNALDRRLQLDRRLLAQLASEDE